MLTGEPSGSTEELTQFQIEIRNVIAEFTQRAVEGNQKKTWRDYLEENNTKWVTYLKKLNGPAEANGRIPHKRETPISLPTNITHHLRDTLESLYFMSKYRSIEEALQQDKVISTGNWLKDWAHAEDLNSHEYDKYSAATNIFLTASKSYSPDCVRSFERYYHQQILEMVIEQPHYLAQELLFKLNHQVFENEQAKEIAQQLEHSFGHDFVDKYLPRLILASHMNEFREAIRGADSLDEIRKKALDWYQEKLPQWVAAQSFPLNTVSHTVAISNTNQPALNASPAS